LLVDLLLSCIEDPFFSYLPISTHHGGAGSFIRILPRAEFLRGHTHCDRGSRYPPQLV